YGLALHLTRDRSMADDAFQEAMLRIWRATESFRPQNTRGWIFRIVARECTRVRKSACHRRKRSEKFHAYSCRTAHEDSEAQEREGAFALLTELLSMLTDRDRHILTLQIYGGLSQRKISAL